MLQLCIYGFILGSILVLGAIGLSLVYAILRFANFSHGDLMMVGAYLGLFFMVGMGLPFPLAFALAMLAGAAVGVGLDRVWFRPLRRRRAGAVILAISSLALALVLRNLVRALWGPQAQYYGREIETPHLLPFLGVKISNQQLAIILTAAGLVALVHLFLTRTKLGKSMRATADNLDLARVSGIDIDRVIFWTWALGAALAAAGGMLLGMSVRLQPVMGWDLLLPMFAATILGGIGSPWGAMAGGMIIGLAQELSTAFISTAYKPAVAFIVLILILLFRPTGISGVRS